MIGYPLKNSFSIDFFTHKFSPHGLSDYDYKNFPLESLDFLPALIEQHPTLAGFNITVPYKQSIIQYLDQLDESAVEVGAVNCVKVVATDYRDTFTKAKLWSMDYGLKTIGYNTDVFGFDESLKNFLPQNCTTKALILGTGGAAKAVSCVLKKRQIPFQFVSRNPASGIPYSQVTESTIHSINVLINCTPLGMFPDTEKCPDIPYEYITDKHFCYDLIYLPEETQFLKKCREQGAKTKNGLEMLHLQAEKSWEIWTAPDYRP